METAISALSPGGDVVVPAGTGADSLTTEDSQNGDQIDRTYLFNGTSVGSAVLEVVQSDDTASVQEGQQHMQAAKDYSDNHTEIPYFVIAGVFLLLLILLIWRIVKIVKSIIKKPSQDGIFLSRLGFLY